MSSFRHDSVSRLISGLITEMEVHSLSSWGKIDLAFYKRIDRGESANVKHLLEGVTSCCIKTSCLFLNRVHRRVIKFLFSLSSTHIFKGPALSIDPSVISGFHIMDTNFLHHLTHLSLIPFYLLLNRAIRFSERPSRITLLTFNITLSTSVRQSRMVSNF